MKDVKATEFLTALRRFVWGQRVWHDDDCPWAAHLTSGVAFYSGVLFFDLSSRVDFRAHAAAIAFSNSFVAEVGSDDDDCLNEAELRNGKPLAVCWYADEVRYASGHSSMETTVAVFWWKRPSVFFDHVETPDDEKVYLSWAADHYVIGRGGLWERVYPERGGFGHDWNAWSISQVGDDDTQQDEEP